MPILATSCCSLSKAWPHPMTKTLDAWPTLAWPPQSLLSHRPGLVTMVVSPPVKADSDGSCAHSTPGYTLGLLSLYADLDPQHPQLTCYYRKLGKAMRSHSPFQALSSVLNRKMPCMRESLFPIHCPAVPWRIWTGGLGKGLILP